MLLYVAVGWLGLQAALASKQWVDPHDMNVAQPNFAPRSPDSQLQHCDCLVPINLSISRYKRLIHFILSATKPAGSSHEGRLYINLPADDYDFLKSFAGTDGDKEDSAALRKVDSILSRNLVKPYREYVNDALLSWTEYVYVAFYNRSAMILLSCLFLIFISYKLLRANLTIWSVVKYLIFLGWVTDFAFTWINLLQEAEINKMADSAIYEAMPPHCNPSKMSFLQYLMYSVGTQDECRKYHHAVYRDTFWAVAPVTVLSHQFGVLVYTPASHLGQAVGIFTSGLLSSLPWGINVVLLPMLLVFSAIIVCIVFSFATDTSFGFKLFHLVQLEFGNRQRQAIGDVLTGQSVHALLGLAHRRMVEDVRQMEPPRTDGSDCSAAHDNPVKEETGAAAPAPALCQTKETISSVKCPDECEALTVHGGGGDSA